MDIRNICIHCMHENPNPSKPCRICGKENTQYIAKPHHLQPLSTLNSGKYVVGRVLGQGMVRITYLGLDTQLRRPVVIKELFLKDLNRRDPDCQVSITPAAEALFNDNRKRLRREALVLAALNAEGDEGIVHVQEYFEENNTLYVVMEYINGITLKNHIEQNGKVSYEEALRIIQSVGHALDKLHQHNMTHMEVCPDNIMITPDGTVKLLDCGTVTYKDKQLSSTFFSGQQGFTPPELNSASGHGPWTDVYSLAATMYFCLTGTVPTDAGERQEGKELKSPAQLGAKINSKSNSVLMTAMELNPEKRYQTMPDFLNSLMAQTKKPNKILWGVIGVCAAVALVSMFLFSGNDKPTPPQNDNPTLPIPTEPTSKYTGKYEVGDTVPLTLGTYIVRSYADPDLILGIDSGFGDNGARLVLKKYQEANRNRIMVTDAVVDDGYYNLQIAHTSSFLQANNTVEMGSNIIQNSKMLGSGTENWVFVYAGDEDGKPVFILRNGAGSVLAAKDGHVASGTSAILAEEDLDDPAQKWIFEWNPRDNTESDVIVRNAGDIIGSLSGHYILTSAATGDYSLSVSRYEQLAEPELIVWTSVDGITQQFRFELVSDYRYRIYPILENENLTTCLEYDEESGRVLIRSIADNTNQYFRVIYAGYNTYTIQTNNGFVLGYEIGEDGRIEGNPIIVRSSEEFSDKNFIKWLLKPVA